MDEERRRLSPQTLIVILLFVAAALFLSAGVVLLAESRNPVPGWPDVEGLDASAKDMQVSFKTKLFGLKLNDEGKFSYSVLKSADVDEKTGKCTLQIANPPENRYLMTAEITLTGSDEVIYRSGYIKPNQCIEIVRIKKMPGTGSYGATVHFYAVDFDTLDILGALQQDITLNIKQY